MRSKKFGDKFMLRIDHGGDLIQSIKKFCSEQNIKAAYFTGFGGLFDPVLSLFDIDTKVEESRKFVGDFGIASLHGLVSMHDKDLDVRCSVCLNDAKFQLVGGELLEAQARICVELLVKPIQGSLVRDVERKYRTLLLDL